MCTWQQMPVLMTIMSNSVSERLGRSHHAACFLSLYMDISSAVFLSVVMPPPSELSRVSMGRTAHSKQLRLLLRLWNGVSGSCMMQARSFRKLCSRDKGCDVARHCSATPPTV